MISLQPLADGCPSTVPPSQARQCSKPWPPAASSQQQLSASSPCSVPWLWPPWGRAGHGDRMRYVALCACMHTGLPAVPPHDTTVTGNCNHSLHVRTRTCQPDRFKVTARAMPAGLFKPAAVPEPLPCHLKAESMRNMLQATSSMLCSMLKQQQANTVAEWGPVINLLAAQARMSLYPCPPDQEGRRASPAARMCILDALVALESASGEVWASHLRSLSVIVKSTCIEIQDCCFDHHAADWMLKCCCRHCATICAAA